MESTAAASSSSTQVRVIVRLRPLLPHETSNPAIVAGAKESVRVTETEDKQPAILLKDIQQDSFGKETQGETLLSFDGVYPATVSQESLFASELLPHLASRVFSGQTATVFAYGMTGTGKSHTMNGSKDNPGLIPRTIQHVFDTIQDRCACDEQEWSTTTVSFSYFELYNEKIYDLLKPAVIAAKPTTDRNSSDSAIKEQPGDLPVREDAHGKVFVANLSETRIDSYAAFAAAYAQGMKNRKIASTKYNATSSRAHTMILIKVEYKTKKAPFRRITGRIQLLDLAGNEDNRFSGNAGSKSRMNESSKINNSLFVLGKVINALNAGETRIPYRDSKLTRLLQDSLGGSNYSIMICNISPNPQHMMWTQRTLNFAMKSRQVMNVVEKNVIEQPLMIEESKQDLKLKLESWRRDHGKLASSTSMSSLLPPSAAPKRMLSSLAAPAQQTTTVTVVKEKMDPAVMKKLDSLSNDLNTMKQALVQQQRQQQQNHIQLQKQQQQQQRPSSAQPSFNHPPQPSSHQRQQQLLQSQPIQSQFQQQPQPLIPLTPMSSANVARSCVEKAKAWEKVGLWSKALEEYREAARIRPENEKLQLKIEQVERKVEAMLTLQTNQLLQGGKNQPSHPSTTNFSTQLIGTKHGRDATSSVTSSSTSSSTNQPSKHRKLTSNSKTAIIPEENEDDLDNTARNAAMDESMTESEEEEESEAESDYDPMDEDEGDRSFNDSMAEEEDIDAKWMKRGKTTRSTRSNPGSEESSPTTSPASQATSSLMQRLNSKNSPIQPITTTISPRIPSTSTTTLTRPSTSPHLPTASSLAKATVRTPLANITAQTKNVSPSVTVKANTTLKTTPTNPQASISKGSPQVIKSSNEIPSLPNSKSVEPLPKTVITKAAQKSAAPSLTSLLPAPAAPVAAPIPSPGLLLSNLVSGRDNLLKLLNQGTLKELMELQTIGKKRAQLIIAKREEMGQYVTLADLGHIGLSETQVEQFTQRNLMSTMWTTATTQQMNTAE